MSEDYKTALKDNAIRLADHHRLHCEGAECNISLSMLGQLLVHAGIELNTFELQRFM